jgi:hypothetical protein
MSHWPLAFLEFFVVIAFGLGWLYLEWYCKRLDKPSDVAQTVEEETPNSTAAARHAERQQ